MCIRLTAGVPVTKFSLLVLLNSCLGIPKSTLSRSTCANSAPRLSTVRTPDGRQDRGRQVRRRKLRILRVLHRREVNPVLQDWDRGKGAVQGVVASAAAAAQVGIDEVVAR